MTLDLKKLHLLTHDRLDSAIETAIFKNPDLEKMMFQHVKNAKQSSLCFFSSEYTPYKLLAALLYENERDNDSLLGMAVLAALFDVTIDVLQKNLNALAATRIFLKFKVTGVDYQSEIGNGNSCLHDAINIREFSNDLINILIANGADPDLENDDRLTPFAVFIQDKYGYNNKVISDLRSYDRPSYERISNIISTIICDANEDPMLILNTAVHHGFFIKHPEILNFNYHYSRSSNLLLHYASQWSSSEVILCMLHNGANPDLTNVFKFKPIDFAVEKAMNLNDSLSHEFLDTIKSIAYLLLYSLIRSFPSIEKISPADIVDALLNLALVKNGYRELTCITLFSSVKKNEFNFNLTELLSLLKKKSQTIHHDEIEISSLIGKGGYGNVFKGKLFDTNGSTDIAIKQSVKSVDEPKLRLEANIHAKLKHHNIIRFMGTMERTNGFGMILEFAGGGSLKQFIEVSSREEVSLCLYSFAKQMNDGLKYIHSEGYVHLDFKSDNILLDDANKLAAARIMIADFGAAAKAGESKPHNVTTQLYCAPERFDWEIPYDYANDTFSFGVVIGVIDTKNEPWIEIISDSLIPVRICQGKRTTFGNTNLQLHVAELIKLCCDQDPNKRPSCDEIDTYVENHFKPF